MTISNNFFFRRIAQLLRLASVLIMAGCALWLGYRGPVNYARTVTPANPLFAQETKLTASDGAANEVFGLSVAVSGPTVVVGAPGDNFFQGSAYVFEFQSGVWVQTQKLTASDGASGDIFGDFVAASGSTIVVGAIGSNITQGSAYVFERQGGGWVETQKLTASDGELGDFFGRVAVSDSTIVVGAPNDKVGENFAQGSAYVFERQGGGWVETQKLTASDGAQIDQFGESVAVSGSTIVVSAPIDTIGGNVAQGSAYVFERQGGGWVETQKLTASDGALADVFGGSVAVSGSTVVVGASFDDIGDNFEQGSAYVFERQGGSWVETQRLTVSDGANGDLFGVSVAISASTIVVGTQGSDISGDFDHGSAYVFERRGGSWVEAQKLTASDGASGDNFGHSVSVSGSAVVVGAPGDNFFQGSAYVFERQGGS
jgi:hypothetical protein